MPTFVHINDYARLRNVSDRCARQWRNQGRLVLDLTGLVNVEASDALRLTTAKRIRTHPPKLPTPPPAALPPPVAAFVLEEHLIAAGIAAAAELVAEGGTDPSGAVMTAQTCLYNVADVLARAGLYRDDPIGIALRINPTAPGVLALVEVDAARRAAEYAAEDQSHLENAHD